MAQCHEDVNSPLIYRFNKMSIKNPNCRAGEYTLMVECLLSCVRSEVLFPAPQKKEKKKKNQKIQRDFF